MKSIFTIASIRLSMSYNEKHALDRIRSNCALLFRRRSPSSMDWLPAIITLMTITRIRRSSRNRSANERCFAIGSVLIRKRTETIGVIYSIRSWPICVNGRFPLKRPQLDMYIQAYFLRDDCRARWTTFSLLSLLLLLLRVKYRESQCNVRVCVFSSCP